MIRVGVHGSTGRMGQAILEVLSGSTDLEKAASVSSQSGAEDFEGLFSSNVIVDFSSAAGLENILKQLSDRLLMRPAEELPAVLSGTTALSSECRQRLETLASQIPVLWAPNFSLGIHLVQKALNTWRDHPALHAFQTHILDVHHAQKKDAPSGTALLLQEALGQRSPIESIREGIIIGRHEVELNSPRESIKLIHDVQDRRVFAEGALFSAGELATRRGNLPKKLLTLDDLFASSRT